MTLDIRTVFFLSIFIQVSLAFFLFWVWITNRTVIKGLQYWFLAFVFGIVSLILASYRDIISDFVSIVITNTISAAFYPFCIKALYQIKNVNKKGNINFLGIPIIFIVFMIFGVISPNFRARTIIFSIINVYFTAKLIVILTRNIRAELRKSYYLVAFFFGLQFLVFSLSLVLAIVRDPGDSLMQTGNSEAFGQFFAISSNIGLALGFVLIVINQYQVIQMGITRELKHMAEYDSLTNLYNRRHFFHLVDHELAKSIRYKNCISLLILDLDNFKQVNDIFGHSAGDSALQMTAEEIKKISRESDILGRFGGDEFVILALESTREDVQRLAKRLCEAISLRLKNSSFDAGVTVSIGIYHFCGEEKLSHDKFFDRADKVLYEAKQSGKNCVRI